LIKQGIEMGIVVGITNNMNCLFLEFKYYGYIHLGGHAQCDGTIQQVAMEKGVINHFHSLSG
jgi:hypothetical protein